MINIIILNFDTLATVGKLWDNWKRVKACIEKLIRMSLLAQ